MQITKETLEKIAHLARLEIKPEEEAGLLNDLNEILVWVEKLNEVNTDGVEPIIHMTREINGFRDDLATNALAKADGLKLAPDHDGNFFRVPKVIKDKSK
ncbi:MAG: Asp-tRNA(Asn)/Glu-tRNA(Gln) amidotransferase subunit GatC [Bacteroidetes bacterium]|nr:Asp-tRNA(Asn)/Glu-tRNA(Gln) amidotransferase subunit GatC [Bacteroidota bacterium]MDA1121095.1 Asp-tRNA(Asn)/Glu-tRNA(Gln) amidotransferase subunit GatC [Bacteroidota bacterium]